MVTHTIIKIDDLIFWYCGALTNIPMHYKFMKCDERYRKVVAKNESFICRRIL